MAEALERGKRIKTILRTGQDTTGSGDVWPRTVGKSDLAEGGYLRGAALSPERGMCYNLRAVKDTGKQETAPAELRGATVAEFQWNTAAKEMAALSHEDASRYCPICSERLESRRCKLVCNGCGYYMSCADYY